LRSNILPKFQIAVLLKTNGNKLWAERKEMMSRENQSCSTERGKTNVDVPCSPWKLTVAAW
jgi:hypothetical protein